MWELLGRLLDAAGDYLGWASRTRREKRAEVLEAVSRFRTVVEPFCSGYTPALLEGALLHQRFDQAHAALRLSLDRNSPFIGKRWLRKIEQLRILGCRIFTKYMFAYSGQRGPSVAQAMEDGNTACKEFKTLFTELRGG